jgi:hypothetical protein
MNFSIKTKTEPVDILFNVKPVRKLIKKSIFILTKGNKKEQSTKIVAHTKMFI